MEIASAQRDIRRAYVGGGPGTLISGLVWLAAAVTLRLRGVPMAFLVLFVGGMLIFGLSVVVCRLVFRRAPSVPDNPLGRVALESTLGMLGGLIAAWLFLRYKPEYVLPLAAIAVGTHYAAFRTAYGDGTFWVLGGLMTVSGCIAIFSGITVPGGVALTVSVLEIAFGIVLTLRAMREASSML